MFQCRVNETEIEKEETRVSRTHASGMEWKRRIATGGKVRVGHVLHELERRAGTPG